MAGGGTDYGMATPSETGFSVSQQNLSGGGGLKPSKEVINTTTKVGSTHVSLYESSSTAAKGKLVVPESVSISNSGGATTAIIMKLAYWTDITTKGTSQYLQFLVPSNSTINFPMSRVIISEDASDTYRGSALAQAAPDSNMYRDSSADNDSATEDAMTDDLAAVVVYLEDGHSKYFRKGDLIRLDNEIMEVTAVGTGADLANSTLTVSRGLHGSDIAVHADDVAIRLPFFNAYHNFTAATGGYDKVQTDNDGKFKCTNFFGYGRGLTSQTTGILAGSVSFKFYNSGYQELGLSGITPNTNTGLTAGGQYQFDINVDGAGAFDVQFTVDANNTKFGGTNGVLNKIQEALNAGYYVQAVDATGYLFEKKVTVSIVNGDVRFTSGQCLSTSSIALTDSSGSNTDWWGVGRIPALAKRDTAVAAKLPDNTLSVRGTGQSVSNQGAFMYDDGKGNLIGAGTGTIDYETGAVDFTSKPNAEFEVAARYGSVLTGDVSSDSSNTIEDITAVSVNDKLETFVSLKINGHNIGG